MGDDVKKLLLLGQDLSDPDQRWSGVWPYQKLGPNLCG